MAWHGFEGPQRATRLIQPHKRGAGNPPPPSNGTNMKIIRNHHRYELDNFENKEAPGQVLQFIEKEPVQEGSSELRTVSDGTTNEEVLRVLIDRLKGLGQKFPCRQNAIAITKLEEALMWLDNRTAERRARGVEGKHTA